MSARLYAVAGALAAGTIIAELARPPWWVLVVWLAGGAALIARRATLAGVLALTVVCSCVLTTMRLASLDGGALATGAHHGADVRVDGEVLGDPQADATSTRFTLGARRAEIDGRPLRLRERVTVTVRPPSTVTAGDIVRIDGRLSSLTFPGADALARAAARRARHDGISARLFAPPDGVAVIGRSSNPLLRVAEVGRAAVRRAAARMPEREDGLLRGVTIGDTELLDPVDEADFRATGLSHIVAVSGANVAYVLAVIAFLLRFARAGRKTTLAVMAVALPAFVAIARFEPSVMRAGFMTAIGLGGIAAGARREATTALAGAVIVMQLADPFVIWQAGFELSVLATLGLLLISPHVAAMLPSGRLAEAAAVTIGAQLAVAPLIAASFHQLSLISVAANIAAVPAVAPATVLGLVGAAGETIWHPLGVIAIAARPPIEWMLWVSRALAQVPLASVRTPAGALGFMFVVLLLWLAVAIARGKRLRLRATTFALALALVATGGVWTRAIAPVRAGLVLAMFDVGQGDAFVVRTGGKTMLIDGGPDARHLMQLLVTHHIARVDLLVMTHPHLDHIDGLARVAASFPLSRALDPFIDSSISSYRLYESSLARRHIPRDRAAAGMQYRLGDATIDVLWPRAVRLTDTPEDVNNNSVVLRLRYGSQTILFAGETQEEAQTELLKRPDLLRADVVKVSHHGSRHMVPAFYAATHARLALIPVGPNTFGHPSPQTLDALIGMRVCRSDRNGEVTVTLDGVGGMRVDEQRAA
ncbi:MAG: ComEC/Rec2 family competence protein [Actinomycetota bacterium]